MRPNVDVGEAAFIEARPDFNKNAQPGDLIVAGENFGCGSSREYAAEALRNRKVGAIIAASYARIFYRNALNLGIPLITAPELAGLLEQGQEVELDLENSLLRTGENSYLLPELPLFARQVLEAGGIVAYVKAHNRFPGEA
jgi:methanogen homoaconitase small subunit